MLYMFVHTKSFVACVPVRFFSLLLIFALLATSISHFLTANFHVFLPTKFAFFVFLSNTLALYPLSTSVKTFLFNRTWLCCCFFSLKCPGGHAISRPKTPCCIRVAIPGDWIIIHWYTCGVDGSAHGHVITKIFMGCIDNQMLLPVVPCTRGRSAIGPLQVGIHVVENRCAADQSRTGTIQTK